MEPYCVSWQGKYPEELLPLGRIYNSFRKPLSANTQWDCSVSSQNVKQVLLYTLCQTQPYLWPKSILLPQAWLEIIVSCLTSRLRQLLHFKQSSVWRLSVCCQTSMSVFSSFLYVNIYSSDSLWQYVSEGSRWCLKSSVLMFPSAVASESMVIINQFESPG